MGALAVLTSSQICPPRNYAFASREEASTDRLLALLLLQSSPVETSRRSRISSMLPGLRSAVRPERQPNKRSKLASAAGGRIAFGRPALTHGAQGRAPCARRQVARSLSAIR